LAFLWYRPARTVHRRRDDATGHGKNSTKTTRHARGQGTKWPRRSNASRTKVAENVVEPVHDELRAAGHTRTHAHTTTTSNCLADTTPAAPNTREDGAAARRHTTPQPRCSHGGAAQATSIAAASTAAGGRRTIAPAKGDK
jgi:hypothetical protein